MSTQSYVTHFISSCTMLYIYILIITYRTIQQNKIILHKIFNNTSLASHAYIVVYIANETHHITLCRKGNELSSQSAFSSKKASKGKVS